MTDSKKINEAIKSGIREIEEWLIKYFKGETGEELAGSI